MPVVVYTGPTRSPSQLATLSSDIAAEPDKKKTKHHKATAARSNDDQPAPEKPANKKSVVAKPTDAKPIDAKPAAKPSDTKTAAQASARGGGAEEAGQAQAGRGASRAIKPPRHSGAERKRGTRNP